MDLKRRLFFVIVAILFASTRLSGQNVSLHRNNITIKEALSEIKSQSGCSFVYATEDIDLNKIVSIDAESLEEALDDLLAGQSINYGIQGKNIVLKKQVSDTKTQKPRI